MTNHDGKRICTKCRFLALGRLYLKCYQGRFLSTSHSVREVGMTGEYGNKQCCFCRYRLRYMIYFNSQTHGVQIPISRYVPAPPDALH